MKFKNAGLVEDVVWQMRLADLPRGTNRAAIDRLANGLPPYTPSEQEEENAETNVNYLEFPEHMADARKTYYNAFLKPGDFFTVTCRDIPQAKPEDESSWSKLITRELNDLMKRKLGYFEFLRSQFAMTVLHGIGPAFWPDKDRWCPVALGLEDTLIPSDTLLTMENLSHFAVFRQFTVMELKKATEGRNVDPGWNMDMVRKAIEWADSQTWKEQTYTNLYAPEKVEEIKKENLGWYGTDCVPTIDAWDFYFWDDIGKKQGWRRRMVLDTPMSSEMGPGAKAAMKSSKVPNIPMPSKTKYDTEHGQWFYNPGEKRIYADDREQIIAFQFADAAAVAPFKYHSVRSLGWLLYAVCHLQNRLRCKLNDSIFEHLMQFFRVSNPDDHQRIVKANFRHWGEIPEGVSMVGRNDRWAVDQAFVELGLTQNQERMQAAAAQYREGRDLGESRERTTATEIMAKVNAANALVGSMLIQSYQYYKFQCREIARRFCRADSRDPDVKEFRKRMKHLQVPDEALDVNLWEIEPQKVLGNGNKTLELAMADKLFAMRPVLDPEAQREVDSIYITANSDQPELADRLTGKDSRKVSDSVHDAGLMFGTLMQGVAMAPVKGQNAVEIIQTLMAGMTSVIERIGRGLTPPDMKDIVGLEMVGATIRLYFQQMAGDKTAKENMRALGQQFTQIMGQVAQLTKQTQTMQQQPQGGNGSGEAQKEAAKAQAVILQARTKAQLAAESHRQRTEQRDVQFRMQIAHDEEKHVQDLKHEAARTRLERATADLTAAADIKRNRLKSVEE